MIFLSPFCELSRLVSGFLQNFIRKFANGILLRQLSLYPWRPSVMFPIYSSSWHKNVELNCCLCVIKHSSIATSPPSTHQTIKNISSFRTLFLVLFFVNVPFHVKAIISKCIQMFTMAEDLNF